MAGIVASLEADDDVGLLRQPIDDLAFAFVPPLGADHDNICHEELSPPGRWMLIWVGYRPQPWSRILDDVPRSKAKQQPSGQVVRRQAAAIARNLREFAALRQLAPGAETSEAQRFDLLHVRD